ncbi:hypothetical protein GBAR_LOCUS5338, partial [Geodia barretti]
MSYTLTVYTPDSRSSAFPSALRESPSSLAPDSLITDNIMTEVSSWETMCTEQPSAGDPTANWQLAMMEVGVKSIST